MVTANVIERVLHVGTPDGTGTAFVVERAGKSYIVTAAHVLRGIADNLLFRYQEQWHDLPIRVIGLDAEADVVVLAYRDVLSAEAFHPVTLSTAGLVYGQTVYFLGYPHGWEGSTRLLSGRPIPFVKAGTLSMLPDGRAGKLWVDAHGNKGFSGGPLAFQVPGSSDWSIGGVVSARVLDPTDPERLRHAGFVTVASIESVIRLIEANPEGVPVLRRP